MQIQENISLRNFNTFGIDARAKYFASFESLEELEEIVDSDLFKHEKNSLILGGGSNMLFTKNYDGIVLKNALKGISCISEDENSYIVSAAAGEVWHKFVLHCIAHQYAGIENLSLIPGNVGASPIQNIGAYGVEIKDVFYSLEAYHKKDKKVVELKKEACAFGYRDSIFKHQFKEDYIILKVNYRLQKQPVFHTQYGNIEAELQRMGVTELSIQNISQAVIQIRQSKLPDPAVIGNAGSFFKNPIITPVQWEALKQQFPHLISFPFQDAVKLSAAWLIESCGWKGYREGDAGCHEKQALVLVNYGRAHGREIFALSQKIIDSVYQKFHVELEREVNIY
ncbi:MAG: UDP-N-acetylmuramate dehydrogenase [Bacteroidetes bacterium]|nr:UDP-N-acetylmuramate dehydrogenase [Bacteroidota bacterium]